MTEPVATASLDGGAMLGAVVVNAKVCPVLASNSESVLVIPELLPCSRMLVAMADKSRSGGWRLAQFEQTIKPKFGLAPSSRARRVYNSPPSTIL